MPRMHDTATLQADRPLLPQRASHRLSQTMRAALRWVVRQGKRAFLYAGSPTSVKPGYAATDEGRQGNHVPRPGGSLLRRFD